MKQLFLSVALLFSIYSFSQYQGVLWKISGNGLKKDSYLLGTMHSADNRAFKNVEKIKTLLGQCDAYAMEVVADASSLGMGTIMKLMMKGDTTLSMLFTKAEYKTLDSLMQKNTGFPLVMLEKMQPIVLSVLVSKADMASDSSAPLDFYLQDWAKENGKKIIGIETVQEQLEALQALSYSEQAQLIKEELAHQNGTDIMEQLFRFYTGENLDSLAALNNKNPMPPKLEKALVGDRNKRMIERIAEIVRKQPTFCAVGALHLPMQNGIIEGLRKIGFVVEAVK